MANAKSKKGDKPDSEKPDTGQNQALAQVAQGSQRALAMLKAAGVTIKQQLTVPMLLLQPAKPRVLVFTSAIVQSTYQDEKNKKDEPMLVADVGDVQTGESLRLVISSVVKSALQDESKYPLNENGTPGYVGKTFYMEKLPKRPGKRHFDHIIVEVDVPAGATLPQLSAPEVEQEAA